MQFCRAGNLLNIDTDTDTFKIPIPIPQKTPDSDLIIFQYQLITVKQKLVFTNKQRR